jgi:hypothetical protein
MSLPSKQEFVQHHLAGVLNPDPADECPICKESYHPPTQPCPTCDHPYRPAPQPVVHTPCEPVNHAFHRHCLIEWFDSPHGRPNCPSCRTQLFRINNARPPEPHRFVPDRIIRPPTTQPAEWYYLDYFDRYHGRQDLLGPQDAVWMTPQRRLPQLRQEDREDMEAMQNQQMTPSSHENTQTPVNSDPASLTAEEPISAQSRGIRWNITAECQRLRTRNPSCVIIAVVHGSHRLQPEGREGTQVLGDDGEILATIMTEASYSIVSDGMVLYDERLGYRPGMMPWC